MSKVDISIHICVYPLLFFSVQMRHYSGHLDVPHLRTNKLRQTNFQRTGCVKQLWKSEDCKSPCRAEGPVNLPWLGFERDEGKVSIQWGIEGQGIITPFPFSLYYQGWSVLPLSLWQWIFSTGAKVWCPVLAVTMLLSCKSCNTNIGEWEFYPRGKCVYPSPIPCPFRRQRPGYLVR